MQPNERGAESAFILPVNGPFGGLRKENGIAEAGLLWALGK
jgi:hypothetical protein